jgi:hypothetical protein
MMDFMSSNWPFRHSLRSFAQADLLFVHEVQALKTQNSELLSKLGEREKNRKSD